MEWHFVAALPGLDSPSSIEGEKYALIGSSDARYLALIRKYKNLDLFLSSFRNPFNSRLDPAIIVYQGPPDDISREYVVTFRNIVAVAAVIAGRVKKSNTGTWVKYVSYSDYFNIYPVSIDRLYEDLIIYGPLVYGLDDVDRFSGQPTPSIVYPKLSNVALDEELATALFDFFSAKKGQEAKAIVGRSMEIAFSALQSSFHGMGSKIDLSMSIMHWISSVETLVNMIRSGVNSGVVVDVVGEVPWASSTLTRRNYKKVDLRKGKTGLRSMRVRKAAHLIGRLYRIRHNYVHGEAFPKNGIEPNRKRYWGSVEDTPHLIYRFVLLYSLSKKGFFEFPRKPRIGEDPTRWLDQEEYEKPLVRA